MTSQIRIIKLKVIKNKKGDILKYLNKKSSFFKKFGESYFNEIFKNEIKGWNYHSKYTCLLSVIFGKIEFKYKKNLNGKTKKIILSRKRFSLLIVPPKIWFSFKGLEKKSIVINTIDGLHDDKEVKKFLI